MLVYNLMSIDATVGDITGSTRPRSKPDSTAHRNSVRMNKNMEQGSAATDRAE
jgi:hypothetical protein